MIFLKQVIILSEPVFGDYYIPIKDELCGEDIEISLKKKILKSEFKA